MTDKPRVSTVIPTYNRPRSTVKSVKSALNQTWDNYEVIVVDDGSTDNTWKEINNISDENLKTIRHESNKGGNAARNTGIKQSTSDYVAFLDSDDTWKKDKIDKQINYILKQNIDACYCGVNHSYDSSTKKIGYQIKSRIDRRDQKPEGGEELVPLVLSTGFPLGGSSTLVVKRKLLNQIGMFDEKFKRHQDWDLLVRILKSGVIGYLNEELVEKNDTESPGYNVYLEEKRKFLEKYSKEVIDAEIEGTNVIGEHHFELSKLAIRDDNYSVAYRHFLLSNIRRPMKIQFLLRSAIKNIIKSS